MIILHKVERRRLLEKIYYKVIQLEDVLGRKPNVQLIAIE